MTLKELFKGIGFTLMTMAAIAAIIYYCSVN